MCTACATTDDQDEVDRENEGRLRERKKSVSVVTEYKGGVTDHLF